MGPASEAKYYVKVASVHMRGSRVKNKVNARAGLFAVLTEQFAYNPQ